LDFAATKEPKAPSNPPALGILELLSKKDNLEKLANSVSQVVEKKRNVPMERSTPMEVPVKPTIKTPPATPRKATSLPSERFAGLSNSPAPKSLPIPSFSFLDQELNTGNDNDVSFLPVPKYEAPRPLMLMPQSNSPPSNPHLDSMTSQLRMMLNIAPLQS
jgi:hypothetical protein